MMSPPPPSQQQQRIGFPWPELNDGLVYKDAVSSSDSELTTVSDFYSTKYKSSAPLLGWIQRIQNGQIQIDGEVVEDPNTLLRSGSKLVYHRLPWKEPDTPYSLDILYEDDDMIALNKPSGLQVLPGGLFQQRTLLKQLQWCFGKKDSSTGSSRESHPVPVHRLGRGTSGILLCAKTKLAKTKLASYFAEGTSLVGSSNLDQECGTGRKISKIYRALADGIIEEDEVVITQPIGVVRYPGVAKGLYVASPEGKPALSKVAVLERDRQRNCTLVKVEIQSGRPHQIRIHLAYIGHPLVGKDFCFLLLCLTFRTDIILCDLCSYSPSLLLLNIKIWIDSCEIPDWYGLFCNFSYTYQPGSHGTTKLLAGGRKTSVERTLNTKGWNYVLMGKKALVPSDASTRYSCMSNIHVVAVLGHELLMQ